MRPIILACLFTLAMAIPVTIEIANEKSLQKRDELNSMLGQTLKAVVVFGALVWGGGIVARRAIDYYFKVLKEERKKAENEKSQVQMVNDALQYMTAATEKEYKAKFDDQKKENVTRPEFGLRYKMRRDEEAMRQILGNGAISIPKSP